MSGPLELSQVPIDELRPDPANPRQIDPATLDALTRSVRQFGLVDPLIARRENGQLIGGHQRWLAARRAGLDTLPVIYLDLPESEARLLALALNQISGTWDADSLARLFQELQTQELDLSLSGFGEDEIDRLLATLTTRERRDRPESFDLADAVARRAQRTPRVQQGDTWQLGPHRLRCGDATTVGDVEGLIGSAKAAMAFTDPPYNVAYGDHGGQHRDTGRRRIANDALPAEE